MKRHPIAGILAAGFFAAFMLIGLFLLPRMATATRVISATPPPTAVAAAQQWVWPEPGFGGWPAITLTQGIDRYSYYHWWPTCDAPARHQVPMIEGRTSFYTNTDLLKQLFDGPCNDGRPLLFLNEPAVANRRILPRLRPRTCFTR